MKSYCKVSLHCDTDSDLSVGDKIRIVKGRKYPIGTEGIVLRIKENKYGTSSFISALTGEKRLLNPCLLIEFDNNEQIWVNGNNCLNITNIEKSVNKEIYFEDFDLEEKGFVSDKPVWVFDKKENKPIKYTNRLIDYGLSIHRDYFKEFEDRYAMIIDDWRSDTYSFLVFSKEIKSGNEIVNECTGVSRVFTDMNITGLSDAIANFNQYCEEIK